jgi:putative nucleotidyltransferase with HDIG domain
MGKTEPTLFERLETESEKSAQEELTEREGVRHALWLRILIALLTIGVCAMLFPTGFGTRESLTVGSEWQQESIVAEYPFPIYKSQQQYSAEVLRAREQTPPVFTNNGVADEHAVLLESLNAAAADSAGLVAAVNVSPGTLAIMESLPMSYRAQTIRQMYAVLKRFQSVLVARGFINIPRSNIKTSEILVRISPSEEQVYYTAQVVDSGSYRALWDRIVETALPDDNMFAKRLAMDIQPRLFRPHLLYSAELSEAAMRLAEQSVPRTLGIVRKGEIVVAYGERLTESTLQKIRSSDYTRYLYSKSTYNVAAIAGNLIYAAFIYSLLLIYLYIMRKRIYYDNWQLLGISLPLVVIAFAAWQTTIIPTALPIQYLIIVPVMSMLLAIIFDSRTTFTATVAMALLLAGVRGNDYNTALGALLAGTFAGYTVRDLRNRTQIFASIAFIFFGYAAPTIAIAVKVSAHIPDIALQLLFCLINAVISPVLTLGLLFVIERLLNLTTDLRLLEYDNINHPLLVELNEKAPGTYQHTLNVARLAEAAALAIEANPILVKVGSYFHDIGKMLKAEYFVENQINVANKHDRLSPVKSATIIRQHVEDGVELAKDYKLPQRIVDFIPMHHGTMLIQYFYTKALEEAEKKGTEAADEEEFRYPGPRPNSRETGIVMLADAVEAVSHLIDTNDRDVLEHAIDKIIEDRLIDHQLDECDLTMQEITTIKESFVKNLLGTRHQRVQYKDIHKDVPHEADEQSITQTATQTTIQQSTQQITQLHTQQSMQRVQSDSITEEAPPQSSKPIIPP